MVLTRCRVLMFSLSLLSSAVWAGGRICAAEPDLPPFLFLAKNNQQQGLSIDILKYSYAQSKQALPQIERFPWKRCLYMGAVGEVEIVVNVPTAQIDPKPFLISDSFAQLHSVFYASKSRFPKKFAIKDLEDLKNYNLCGTLGAEYDSYGIQTERVDTGAKTLLALIDKTEMGRCDLFIEKREVMAALAASDPQLKKRILNLVERPLPEEEPLGLHFAISRRAPNAAKRLAQINQSIAELNKSGQITRWQAKYLNETAAKNSALPEQRAK